MREGRKRTAAHAAAASVTSAGRSAARPPAAFRKGEAEKERIYLCVLAHGCQVEHTWTGMGVFLPRNESNTLRNFKCTPKLRHTCRHAPQYFSHNLATVCLADSLPGSSLALMGVPAAAGWTSKEGPTDQELVRPSVRPSSVGGLPPPAADCVFSSVSTQVSVGLGTSEQPRSHLLRNQGFLQRGR